MFQSTPVTGRNSLEEVTPLPSSIIPLKGEVSNRSLFLMNLLALLERRPPPAIPPGIGRIYTSEPDRKPVVVQNHADRKEMAARTRQAVLDAIINGASLIEEITAATGLSRPTVFNHCRYFMSTGLIDLRIDKAKKGVKQMNHYFPI